MHTFDAFIKQAGWLALARAGWSCLVGWLVGWQADWGLWNSFSPFFAFANSILTFLD